MKKTNKALVIQAFIFICYVSLLASCASTTSYVPLAGDINIASKNAIYAMMSANSYHDPEKIYFPVDTMGWQLVDPEGLPTTDPTKSHWFTELAYDIFEDQGSNEVIIAIRGTDSLWDYVMSNFAFPIAIPYKQASNEVSEYVTSHPDKKITITGHSLGGGIALHISVDPQISSQVPPVRGLDAITFDSSPRIFDGLGDHHNPANRILIFQNGEALESFRDMWPKIFEVVEKKDIYSYSFDFNGKNYHRSDCLAYGLLKLGATVNPELARMLTDTQNDNQTNKPACMD
jgi:hypothetical protein